jgi:hypothetical protein
MRGDHPRQQPHRRARIRRVERRGRGRQAAHAAAGDFHDVPVAADVRAEGAQARERGGAVGAGGVVADARTSVGQRAEQSIAV